MSSLTASSNPLKLDVNTARKELEAIHKSGHILFREVENTYNSNHFDTPASITAIRKLLKNVAEWINDVSTCIDGVYRDKAYYEKFMVDPLEMDWYTLTPDALKKNIISLYEDGNYRRRLLAANRSEKKTIRQEIIKEIGPIQIHWNAEKKRMLASLHSKMRDCLDYIDDRLAYIDEFGINPRIISIELSLLKVAENFISLFPQRITCKYLPDSFDEYWEEVFRLHGENINSIDVFRMAKRKFLIEPIRPIINIDSQSYSKDQYFTIREKIDRLKSLFVRLFSEKIGLQITDISPELNRTVPGYDYDRHALSFERLKDYGVDFTQIFRCLPGLIKIKKCLGAISIKPGFADRGGIQGSFEILAEDFNHIKIDGEEVFLNRAHKIRKLIKFMYKRAMDLGNRPVLANVILREINSRRRVDDLFKRKNIASHPCHKLLKKVGRGQYIFSPKYLKN